MNGVATPQRVGRFELRRVLGRGAQATVWLAYDTRLEREVALKLQPPGEAVDEDDINHWLREARSVSRLTHPNIVPVFEADVDYGHAFLVFEYVPGRTLAEHLRARGALPPHEALPMMIGLLDALQAAHDGGIVHRDLKPSNVLIDGSGRARVMDFGIAARRHDVASQLIVGTPGYLSPEAARGAPPTPAMDLFAAGLVLVEMLSGRKLVNARDGDGDGDGALRPVTERELALPEDLPSTVDDALRLLLRRAIACDPAGRPPSAQALAGALRDWLAPAAASAAASAAAPGVNGTLDFLLRRMRHKSDFPALSDSVARILRIATSESESLNRLADEILTDVALTHKLLRLVNTVQFSHAGAGGGVSTVSRAVALVGFAGIRNMALSLVMLEHMHDKAHAERLKEEFLRALMAGSLAETLAGAVAGAHGGAARDGEEAFIGAMFQNLGRLLTEFYFLDEARQIRNLAAAGLPDRASAAAAAQAEAAAAVSVLGIGFDELGLGIARSWGLPESLQQSMRRVDGDPPTTAPARPAERLRWRVRAANELTDTLLRSTGEPAAAAAVSAVAERYARAIGLSVREVEAATAAARQRLAQLARAMQINVAGGAAARRLLDAPPAFDKTVAAAPPPAEPGLRRAAAADMLSAGVSEITQSMVESFKLNDVLRMVLETMFRALGFRRVVFCLRDAKTATLTGRFGVGDTAGDLVQKFKVPVGGGSDLFAAVCAKGADTLISDATVASIAARLPAWYRSAVDAPAFLLLPMMLKGAPFALIYADKALPGSIDLDDKALQLLRTLRNQAVMAFKVM